MLQNGIFIWTTLLGAHLAFVNARKSFFGDHPAKPSKDSFYVPNAGFENAKPGTILKSRVLSSFSVPLSLHLFVHEVHQFLYRSTDALDNPIATVTTLLVPKNGDSTKLVSYQLPQDSASIDCAPSYSIQGKGDTGWSAKASIAVIEVLLSKGWYINTSDYEGPDSYFLVGPNAGHCVLDSIRAVISTENKTRLGSHTRIQLWGYSGAAHATGWATQLLDSYAPELNVIGSVFGGTPVDVDVSIHLVNNGPSSGYIFAGLVALSRQYASYGDYLNQALLHEKKLVFLDAANYCVHDLLVQYANQDVQSYSSRPDFLNNTEYKRAMGDNAMGQSVAPRIPILMYHAINDETVPYRPALNMYNDWCAAGADGLEFNSYAIVSHSSLSAIGIPRAIEFMQNLYDGVPYTTGCVSRTM